MLERPDALTSDRQAHLASLGPDDPVDTLQVLLGSLVGGVWTGQLALCHCLSGHLPPGPTVHNQEGPPQLGSHSILASTQQPAPVRPRGPGAEALEGGPP